MVTRVPGFRVDVPVRVSVTKVSQSVEMIRWES
jgi:hypothetical protein